MSSASDFAAVVCRRLDDLVEAEIGLLIKCEPARHDRVAGHIETLQKIRKEVYDTARSWSMRDEEVL